MKEGLLIQKNPPIGESDSDSNFRVLFNLQVIKRNVLATESNSKEKNWDQSMSSCIVGE